MGPCIGWAVGCVARAWHQYARVPLWRDETVVDRFNTFPEDFFNFKQQLLNMTRFRAAGFFHITTMGAMQSCLGKADAGVSITHGPIFAVHNGTSATVWARGDRAGIIRVRCTPAGGSGDTVEGSATLTADEDFTARIELSGLQPSTKYECTVDGAGRSGTFNTPAATHAKSGGACSFVFGSCVGGQGCGRVAGDGPESGFPVFGTMLALRPDFFMCNGDFIYADNAIDPVGKEPWNLGIQHVVNAEGMGVANDLGGFRARYRYHYEDPKLGAFLAATPMLATWDDHEIFDDWGALRLVQQGKGDLLEAGMRAFFEYSVHRGPPEEPRRVYRRSVWGPHCEFFVLDCRSYRAMHDEVEASATPQMNTILGEAQLKWLKTSLADSTCTWKFICTSVPLSYPTGWPRPAETGYDGWSDGQASDESVGPEAELKGILQHIKDLGIANVVWISGDVHFPFALSYDPFGDGAPLVHEIGATPLHALCLPRPPNGLGDPSLKPTCLFAGDVPFGGALMNFGRCVVGEGGDVTFTLCHASSGEPMYELKLDPKK